MAKKVAMKKYTGVYYTESKTKRWRERPDRVYWVAFKDAKSNKLRWERCGWASEGWTPEAAQRKRHELLEKDRTGDYKPKLERESDKITFGEAATKYLSWAESNKKSWKSDRHRYKNHLAPVLKHIRLRHVTPLDLEKLKDDIYKKGLSDATVLHCLAVARRIFNMASTLFGYNGPNPMKKVELPKLNNKRLRFLTYKEAMALLNDLKQASYTMYSISLLSLHTGMRFGEIARLVWHNIDFDNDVILLADTKSGDAQHVYMTPQVKHALNSIHQDHHLGSEFIFLGERGKPLTACPETFELAVERVKLNDGIENGNRSKKVVFHTLRHTFVSWLAIQGTPLLTIKELMRHETIQMTMRYAHLMPDQKRKAVCDLSKAFSDFESNCETNS